MSTAVRHNSQHAYVAFDSGELQNLEQTIDNVQSKIAPVWPLSGSVAVNPYGGLSDKKLLDARGHLRSVSECELLMPVDYYKTRLESGAFGLEELRQAIDEMVADRIPDAETLIASHIYQSLKSNKPEAFADYVLTEYQQVELFSEQFDRVHGTTWTPLVREEISKHCSAHFDEGHAAWPSPFQGLPLFQAWRSAAEVDRSLELIGLSELRELVANLPHTPEAAIFVLLHLSDVPQAEWSDYLLCVALSLPGWSAWAKYKTEESLTKGFENPDFAALLAIRLAYDVAVRKSCGVEGIDLPAKQKKSVATHCPLLRLTLLRANEIGVRNRMLAGIHKSGKSKVPDAAKPTGAIGRKLAQMVFCIDVRSERIRRNLEAQSDEIETLGFAGFFGLPFEYVRMGDEDGTNQLPVLLNPKFRVYEGMRKDELLDGSDDIVGSRARTRGLRYLWKSFQSSAVG